MESLGSAEDLLICFRTSDALLVLGSASIWASVSMLNSSLTLPVVSNGAGGQEGSPCSCSPGCGVNNGRRDEAQ